MSAVDMVLLGIVGLVVVGCVVHLVRQHMSGSCCGCSSASESACSCGCGTAQQMLEHVEDHLSKSDGSAKHCDCK